MAQKEQIQRLMLVARKIKSRPYISLHNLEREVERELVLRGYDPAVSANTLKRDIKKLRDDFAISVEFCRANHGYYIDSEDLDLVESIFEPLDAYYALNVDGGLPSYIITEQYSPMGTTYLQPIISAIKQKRQIMFRYSKYSTTATTHRTISPYALKQLNGRWYVIGREALTSVNKTFGLDRIDELEIINERSEQDPDFDISEQFKHSYGIYSDKSYPVEDVTLSFDAEDGGYLKSVPLHASQEIVAESGKEVIVKLRVRITFDFIMAILSRSNSLKVLAPESLRMRISDIYRAALRRNTLS